jgi:hypothetical protein
MRNHNSESFINGAICAIAFVIGMRCNSIFETDPKMGIKALFDVLDELDNDDFEQLENRFLEVAKKNG